MPVGDIELVRYRSLSDISGVNPVRPAQSEASVVECGASLDLGFSMLKLSKARLTVGDSVTVYWDIHDTCCANDWVGLFDIDSPTLLTNYLDYKQRGVTGAKRGAIKWVVSRSVNFNKVENKCIFKYIHANTNTIRATSPSFHVHNPYAEIQGSGGRHNVHISQDTLNELSVSGLTAFGLKKNIFGKPSPYVKLSIIPSRRHFRSWKHHHGQIAKTSSQSHTINPNWQNEEFVFIGGNDDILEVEVRNKFSGTRPAFSRFLGKLSLPLCDLLERDRQVPECAVNKALCKRTPSDRIQGRIRFLISTMNTNHTALGSQDVTDQENTRPSNLNLLPSTSRASTMMAANPSLRSSAPDLLDLASTPGSSNLQNSPVSPYGSHLDEEDDANNRRRIRDCRPFSEFYSEEFVPLDLDITSPRHRPASANTERNEHQISNGTDAASNSATTQSTESLDNRQEVPEETPGSADSIPDSAESPRVSPVVDEGIATSPDDAETLDESESPMETVDLEVDENVVMEEDPCGVSDAVQEIEEIEGDVNLIHSTPSIRASVASIELTEDSPLRMMEESEQAQDEEATFSPHDAEDSDGMDDDEQFVYSNDGDDEMESGRLTPDEDTNSVAATVISVDSWTYEGSQSSLDENMEGASSSSSPTYVRSGTSANGLSSEERNSDEMDSAIPVAQVSDNEPVVSAIVGSATAGESDALMLTENQGSEESEIGESSETITSAETTNQVSATETEILLDRQLSLVETVDEIIGNNDVNEAASASHSTASASHPTVSASHPTVSATHSIESASHSTASAGQTPVEHTTNVQCVPVSASRSSRTSITRQELFNQIDLSSVAFPMEEAEPDIMDVTPIQSSSTAQLVVNTRPNRVFEANAEFTRRDDARASTRSEGRIVFDDTPTRPARRPKNISRSMSDSRGVRLNNRPERPERTRRRRSETEPRSTIVAFSHEGPVSTFSAIARPVTSSGIANSVTRDSAVTSRKERLRSSVSDPIVVAVPVPTHSPRSRAESYHNAIVASAIPTAAVSVRPLPSPTLESEGRSSVSSEVDTVVAVPVSSAEYTQSEAMSPVHVVTTVTVSSPKGTATNVTPIPSPGLVQTNHTRAVPMRQHSRDKGAPEPAAALLPPTYSNSLSSATTTPDNAHPGAIPKPDSADMDRENITRMLRTYVRSAQVPQRPNQTNDPRLRKPSTEERPAAVEERGRPPRHDSSSSSSRRRSSRQQRQQGERSHSHRDRSAAQPVHLQIQDGAEHRNRRESVDQPLPSNWERGVDSHGRVYYIDHLNRTTTWSRPTREAPQNETNMNDINTHWQSLDRRYQSFRRTLRGRNRQSRVPLPDSVLQNQSNESTTANASSTETASHPGTRPVSSANTPMQSESLPRPPPSSSSTLQPANTSTSTSATPTTTTTHSSSTASSSRPPQAAASSSRGSRSGMSSSARSAALLESPAVKFITRPDFVDFIKTSGVAGQYYFQSQMLKLIVNKVRADPVQFEKYRHQVELVRFLNQFADPQVELSPGWDKKVDLNGRSYFIDHSTRTTTFIDPRLPINGTVRRHRASTETEPRRSRAPPPRPPPPRGHSRENSTDATATPTLTYNQQVIGFLSQPNIEEIIARKQPSYLRNMALKANIRRAQCEGERTLERLSNNVDFVMLLSLFEDDIMSFVPPEVSQKAETSSPCSSLPPSPVRSPPATNRMSATDSIVKGGASSVPSPAPYRRDFEAKVRSFHRQLYHKGYGQGPNKIKMAIRRDRLLEDAYDQIMKETARSLQRNRLEIQFAGEEGLDYGGPAREFFFLISRQIFNPYYGLFEYSANDTYTVQVSPVSLYVDNSHEWFRFCGRLVGLVVIHQHLLDAFFTRTFYKSLLRSACDLSDVESLDALFHQSMMWVIENNIEDVLDLTFSVSEEIFGQVTERELIPGGKDIAVTEENKDEYVNEMVKWRVERGVSEQMESIVRGFNEVIDPSLVSIFDARELELVISGTADIDIKDWRRNTEYRSGYHDSHKVVKWFWKSVSSFDNEQRLRLLQFVTGTSSIPYEGFAALRGSTGPRKFSIERWGEYTKLPRAHTCFNRLDLPVYRSYDELLEKLTFAVEETGTFSIQ